MIFDKPLTWTSPHLAALSMREDLLKVTRAKENLCCRVARRLQRGQVGNTLRDDLIALTGPTRKAHPGGTAPRGGSG